MPYDELLGVGYEPSMLTLQKSAYADTTNENLSLGNLFASTRDITFTIDNPGIIDSFQFNLIVISGVNKTLAVKIYQNEKVLKSSEITNVGTYVPLVVLEGSFSSAIEVRKGDIFKLECSAPGLVGAESIVCVGTISAVGKYI